MSLSSGPFICDPRESVVVRDSKKLVSFGGFWSMGRFKVARKPLYDQNTQHQQKLSLKVYYFQGCGPFQRNMRAVLNPNLGSFTQLNVSIT